jgi:hypothetical protein
MNCYLCPMAPPLRIAICLLVSALAPKDISSFLLALYEKPRKKGIH